jgi:hypothetical protein
VGWGLRAEARLIRCVQVGWNELGVGMVWGGQLLRSPGWGGGGARECMRTMKWASVARFRAVLWVGDGEGPRGCWGVCSWGEIDGLGGVVGPNR